MIKCGAVKYTIVLVYFNYLINLLASGKWHGFCQVCHTGIDACVQHIYQDIEVHCYI